MAATGKGLPRSLESTDFTAIVPSATTASAWLVKKGAAVTNVGTQTVSGADAAAVPRLPLLRLTPWARNLTRCWRSSAPLASLNPERN